MKIFIDTNIILDIVIKERPGSAVSLKILEIVRERLAEAVVSTQSMIDAYYTAIKNNILKSEVDMVAYWMINHINVRPIGFFEVREAVLSGDKDIEDAAQIALAQTENCDVFITSDKEILKRGKDNYLIYMSPSEFITSMTEA